MHKTTLKPNLQLILMLTALFCLLSPQAMGQVPEDPDPPQVQVTDQPLFITELVRTTALSQEQVQEMRNNNYGWGNMVIAARLAERIAADSGGTLQFNECLANVHAARAEGKGFGDIANENDLKVGRLAGDKSGPNAGNSPPFIAELVRMTELNQDQMQGMRNSNYGWGNIMLATRLAERIAADSGGTRMFDECLASVLAARAEGRGFGEIAYQNDLKLGRLAGNGNKPATAASGTPQTIQAGTGPNGNVERVRVRAKKQNIFGRFFSMLGFGRKERAQKPPKLERTERPERPNRPEKHEKPERPERPEKLERPERPAKPEKPEKPERGPRR